MNKLIVWLMVGVLLVGASLIPKVVYAWDDPIEDPGPIDVLRQPCIFHSNGQWPDCVAGRTPTQMEAPPQLDMGQAYRWRIASPAARPRLAELYGVPQEIAELYWANYEIP